MHEPLRPMYLQRKTRPAGAQHSLLRLLTHPRMREQQPLLVCEDDGWLAGACREEGIDVIEAVFPRGASWLALRRRRRAFVESVCAALEQADISPSLVHGNNYTEAPNAGMLGERLGIASFITLRESSMTRRQFRRQGVVHVDALIANGPWLRDRVAAWCDRPIEMIPNGITAEEFTAPRPLAPRPRQVLVLGNEDPLKGWPDLFEALGQLGGAGPIEGLQWVFADRKPDWADAALEPLKDKGIAPEAFSFVGRQPSAEFRALIEQADLVVHPSRIESFGMAALEVLAAGVPMISTRTGVIAEVADAADLLIEPERPSELAACLQRVLRDWPNVDFSRESAQRRLRERYSLDATVDRLLACYRRHVRQQSTARGS